MLGVFVGALETVWSARSGHKTWPFVGMFLFVLRVESLLRCTYRLKTRLGTHYTFLISTPQKVKQGMKPHTWNHLGIQACDNVRIGRPRTIYVLRSGPQAGPGQI